MEQKYLDDAEKSKWQKLQEKKSKWEKLQDGEWKSSLRITGTDAPARQLMSESGRMRLEARKLRRAGDKEGSNQLLRMAAAEKIAGEPTVKSQAFVDASEEAKNQPSPQSFSFDQDIAPMRGNFFQSNLSGRENSYLQKKYGPSMDDAKDLLDLQNKKNSIRNSDLAYQMNLETLERQRYDNQKKRENDVRVNEISGVLQSIIDGDASNEDKRKGVALYKLENPMAANNSGANTMFGAAASYLQASAEAAAKEKALKETERSRIRQAVISGNVGAVQSIAGEDGVITAIEQRGVEEARKINQKREDEQLEKDQLAFNKSQYDKQLKTLEATRKLIGGVYSVGEAEYLYNQNKDGGLSDKHRAALIATVADQQGTTLKKARELTKDIEDDDLVDLVDDQYRKDLQIHRQNRKQFYTRQEQEVPSTRFGQQLAN